MNHQEAFHALIVKVLSPEILDISKLGLRYSLYTGARGYGCALFQTIEIGGRKPIGFWSPTLNDAEQKYSVTERLWLGVIYDVTICRPYILGENFDLHTDRNCLHFLMLISDPSGRLIRRRLLLAEYS